jgi:hypothetical protein
MPTRPIGCLAGEGDKGGTGGQPMGRVGMGAVAGARA